MIVYFRACEKQATISYVTRHQNINKTTILKKCFKQLVGQLTEDDTLIIVEDQLSKETLSWLSNQDKKCNLIVKSVPDHTWEYHQHTVTLVELLLKYSAEFPNDLHYIVEDDYLHVDNAIQVIKDLYKANPTFHGFTVSYDYPDRYINIEPSQIYLGPDRHWRTITSATMTVIAKGFTWSIIAEPLKQAAPTSNDHLFIEIFKQIPCLAPLPGLSCHMTDRHYTPYYDWNKMFEEITIE